MRTLTKLSAHLIATVLAVASAAQVAKAQAPLTAASVNVPFAFTTPAGQTLQPGTYIVSTDETHFLSIRGKKGSGLTMIQNKDVVGRPVTQGKVVFTCYGDKYFLRSISFSQSNTRLTFARSKEERENQIAAGKAASNVQLAVLQTGR